MDKSIFSRFKNYLTKSPTPPVIKTEVRWEQWRDGTTFTWLDTGSDKKISIADYYEKVPFFADCIDIYVDIASQVEIQEIDRNGNIVEKSDILSLIEQPNQYQDEISFLREMIINILASGVGVFYGNFFKNGSLKVLPRLYNIPFEDLEFPKVVNPYSLKERDFQDLVVMQRMGNSKKRALNVYELGFVYDRGRSVSTDGKSFFNPISRSKSLTTDLNILLNSSETMEYMTDRNVNWLLSRKSNGTILPPLADDQKTDIESKVSGRNKYGMKRGKSDIIATEEDLQLLNLTRDNRKMQMIEIQNNAKENIRSRFGISRDLLDAYTGANRGSTYENQKFAEARLTLNSVKSITDSFLYALEKKVPSYFANGNRLIGSYDHMPSVIAFKSVMKNEGFKARAEALTSTMEAYEKAISGNVFTGTFESFTQLYGFDEFIKPDQ